MALHRGAAAMNDDRPCGVKCELNVQKIGLNRY